MTNLNNYDLELLNSKEIITTLKHYFTTPELQSYIKAKSLDCDLITTILSFTALYGTIEPAVLFGLVTKSNSLDSITELVELLVKDDLLDYNHESNKIINVFLIPTVLVNAINDALYPAPEIKRTKAKKDKSFILGSYLNKHKEDQCVDYLNKVNGIKLCLNENVLAFCTNKWEFKSKDYSTLLKSQRNLAKFNRDSKYFYNTLLFLGNGFYLKHLYDTRGRVYPQGYNVTYIGNQYQKAVISLHDKEVTI